MNLTVQELSKMIDQTLLKPSATRRELEDHCRIAAKYGFKTVALNNAPISFCRQVLDGSGVLCDAAVSFPLGQSTIETKVFETEDVIQKGAGEVDYVINISELKSGNYEYVEREMREIVSVCRKYQVTSKVIFENCYLTEDEKRKLCEIALKVRPDFIKTSTGFGPSGAKLEDVKLMKACVGDAVRIKAAGGIRTIEDALRFIQAGASRLGTSAGVEIINQYQKMLEEKKKG